MSKNLDYADIFLFNLTIKLLKKTDINKYAIKLVKVNQLLYRPIYSPKLVELETLKIYIETYLKIRFIWLSKSFTNVSIFFDWKPNKNLYFYVDYQGLNNLTIKNWYFLFLIGKTLNRLSWAKRFT